MMRKYPEIKKLTTEILHEFIDKIIVHHKEKIFGETIQRVEIYYKMIGQVQIPKLSRSQKDGYKKSFGRTKKSRWLVNKSTLRKESHKNITCPHGTPHWQGQKDLNPRHMVLETTALPSELYPYNVNIVL